eukprot:362069-Chlamydomonas_euryale.AAC.2
MPHTSPGRRLTWREPHTRRGRRTARVGRRVAAVACSERRDVGREVKRALLVGVERGIAPTHSCRVAHAFRVAKRALAQQRLPARVLRPVATEAAIAIAVAAHGIGVPLADDARLRTEPHAAKVAPRGVVRRREDVSHPRVLHQLRHARPLALVLDERKADERCACAGHAAGVRVRVAIRARKGEKPHKLSQSWGQGQYCSIAVRARVAVSQTCSERGTKLGKCASGKRGKQWAILKGAQHVAGARAHCTRPHVRSRPHKRIGLCAPPRVWGIGSTQASQAEGMEDKVHTSFAGRGHEG